MTGAGVAVGTEVVILVAVGFVALALAAGSCVPLIRDRPVPAGALLGGVGIASAAVPLLAWFARPTPQMDLAAVKLALTTGGAIGIVAPLVVGGIGGIQAVFLLLPVARAQRRAWGAAGAIAVAGGLAAALEATGGAVHGNTFFAGVRAALIAAAALACAAVALGAREPTGADGAAAASVGLVLLAGSVQRMLPGIAAILVQKPLLAVVPDARVAGIDRFLAPIAAERPFQWAALAVLAAAAVGTCAWAARVRPTAYSALPWLAVAPAVAAGATLGADALARLATAT